MYMKHYFFFPFWRKPLNIYQRHKYQNSGFIYTKNIAAPACQKIEERSPHQKGMASTTISLHKTVITSAFHSCAIDEESLETVCVYTVALAIH